MEGKRKGKGEGRGRERGEKGKEGGREGVGTEREQKGRGRGLQRAKRSPKEGGSTGDFRNSLAVVISSLSFTQVSIALTPPTRGGGFIHEFCFSASLPPNFLLASLASLYSRNISTSKNVTKNNGEQGLPSRGGKFGGVRACL
jgi:hypothetical protein